MNEDEKIVKVEIVNEKNEDEFLKTIGNTLVDFGKLAFAGILIDKFFNSANTISTLPLWFWAIFVGIFLLSGFILIHLSLRKRR